MARLIQIDLNKLLSGTPFYGKKVKIGVALSGGRDSVALAHALKSCNADIVAINVEHGIRAEASVADSAFVADFCKKYDIPLLFKSVDAVGFSKQNGYTLEQGARILRYGVFDDALRRGDCDLIALAHHADDQAETVMMRILRGTGIKGLAGMRAVNGAYIRPLLGYDRADIDFYIQTHSLPYVDDETNSDVSYTRNYLRQELNSLRQRFPSLNDAFARLSKNATEAEEYISSRVPEPEMSDGEVSINISDLQPAAIGKRLIERAINMLGVRQDVEERHYPLVYSLCDAQNGKYIELTHGIRVHKSGQKIVFDKSRDAYADEVPFREGVIEEFGVQVQSCLPPKDFVAERAKGNLYIDADKLPDGAVVRRRREGDFIQKFGGGSKNLGDWLTDVKLPLRKRDKIAVVASGSQVFAVFGVDISGSVRVDKDSKRVLRLSVTNTDI